MSLWQRPRPSRGSLIARACMAGVLACLPALTAGRSPGLSRAQIQAIERVIAAEMARQKVPGVTVAVGADSRLVWSKGFGRADLENAAPATTATVYRIGSIAKPITAVAVMQLAERARLDLDAPIQKYVPSFPRKPWPITARELLAHMSGIRHYRTADEMNSTRHYVDLLAPLEVFADEPLLFEPGTHYSYTTYGYCLLGAAVEAASGMRFLEYLRRNIFEPAHMQQIRQDDVFEVVPNRAHGYRRGPNGTIQNCAPADTSNKIPGGGLVSTAEDLVRFVAALQHDALLRRETRAQMFTPQHTRDGKPVPYGLGWALAERGGGNRWVTHAGSQPGVSTYLLAAPEEGASVAVLANLEGVRLHPLSARIPSIVLERAE